MPIYLQPFTYFYLTFLSFCPRIEINSQDFEHVGRFLEYPPIVRFLSLKFFNLPFIGLRCDGISCNGIIAEQFLYCPNFCSNIFISNKYGSYGVRMWYVCRTCTFVMQVVRGKMNDKMERNCSFPAL